MLSSLLLDHAVYDDSWLDHLNEKSLLSLDIKRSPVYKMSVYI